jgi:hypothetical protein
MLVFPAAIQEHCLQAKGKPAKSLPGCRQGGKIGSWIKAALLQGNWKT